MSKRIPLTQGKFAIVDDADFEWLNQWKWYASQRAHTCYALTNDYSTGCHRILRMHRLIVHPPTGLEPDHINGNGLDNRRVNLRLCTRSQNSMNRRKRDNCSSKYKGVCWDKQRQKWQARIKLNGIDRFLGRFDLEQDAATAYNKAAVQIYGAFAQPNTLEEIRNGRNQRFQYQN